MNKVALIIPYFGSWPIWFELYLLSCKEQKFIDFHFYTDCPQPGISYTNIYFHTISFKEYCMKVSKILHIQFAPKHPYKLCDLRPFYGVIHREELAHYQFWGYGDIDLIYGDLRKFITPRMLEKYNLITTHADRIAGHFTIIRYNSKYSTICYKIKNWREKLIDEKGLGVDEHDMTMLIRPMNKYIWKIVRILKKCVNIHNYTVFNLYNKIQNVFSSYFIKDYYTSPLPKDSEEWLYNLEKKTIISPNMREIPYLHFLFFKKTPFWNNSHYWRDDFYKITQEHMLKIRERRGHIRINNENIVYEENE